MKVVTLLNLCAVESVYRFKFKSDELDYDKAVEWLESNAKGQYTIWQCWIKDNEHYSVSSGFTIELKGSSAATLFRIVFSE